MTEIKAGDMVVRTGRGHPCLKSKTAYKVRDVSPNGRMLRLEESPHRAFNASYFEVVRPHQPDPEPAEEGVFVCVKVCQLKGEVVTITGPQFKYWVDAERECERASKFLPNETFGVLKLVGTVSMKPTWS